MLKCLDCKTNTNILKSGVCIILFFPNKNDFETVMVIS